MAFADSASVNWSGGSLNLTGTFVPGVSLRFGTTNAGLTSTQLALISAPGVVAFALNSNGFLTPAGTENPYNTWSGGAAFDADANDDGVSNGVAFLLGAADPAEDARDRLPVVSEIGGGLVLTFNCLNSTKRGTAVLSVEQSGDLGITDPWLAAAVPETSGGPVNGVGFSVTPGSPTNAVTATVQVGEAVAGKLFGRLNAENP